MAISNRITNGCFNINRELSPLIKNTIMVLEKALIPIIPREKASCTRPLGIETPILTNWLEFKAK
jgi:hypothetical protein